MTATAPGRGLPPHRFPCSSKSGKRKGFADKRETGSKQPTITQQKSNRPPRLLALPNRPFIPAEEREQLWSCPPAVCCSAASATCARRQTRSPLDRVPSPPWKGSPHPRSATPPAGAPSGARPSHGRTDRGTAGALSSYSGTCCILFLRTRPKTSPQQRWALPARPACRHRRPSHEPALAPRWKRQDLSGTGRGSRLQAGRQGRRKLATSRDCDSR